MLEYLATQPLLALFLIMGVGLALGKVRVFGISLGAAAVLFVAVGVSTVYPELTFPPLLFQFGLAVFVYAIGLSAGRAFFAEFRYRGWKLTVFAIVLLTVMTGVAYLFIGLFGLNERIGAGMYAGSLTSTPGMAAVVALLEKIDPSVASEPVVGYSLAYPGAVLGTIVVAVIGAAVLKVDHHQDAVDEGMFTSPLEWTGVRLRPGITGQVRDLATIAGEEILATRVIIDNQRHELAEPFVRLEPGMVLLIHGDGAALQRAIAKLGEEVVIELSHSDLDYRVVTVSNEAITGRPLGELDTVQNGFMLARIRRGDQELVAEPEETLELSDRVRVIAPSTRMNEAYKFLGNSERQLADVDLLPLAMGLVAGMLIGIIPIPLPGGNVLQLGFGGGPIVAGLILGALGRTGRFNWQLPYHANRTIGSLGLVIFLAGVGTSAGKGFKAALTDPSSLKVVAAGFIITVITMTICGVVCTRLLKLKWDEAMGVAAGITTNPAVISFLNVQTKTELATRGYATVYPAAMIGKIVACQLLMMAFL
ncbi:aspartate:alanine exchanger family transporter [Corynebacterium choanae]|uniref:aspartate:alanine exchanger family transporter n=1 Tax=Corynebacterium choanae TaxID=1862358 RepID=UPI000F4F573A|nr:aspartate:alanine exchanger family transporter [Corynebacterium choanae]